ncbi:hypothetical protein ANN_27700 [Periplaneta americana]|uniref:C2H2-type domain-containing protein n=1 Tax=Periplaneta americana TaxID=6978 RepID=A0ABQ8RV13_PERAM|nr:hypothetical protein ANN_27700 [Periplaneta americana]
MEFDQPSLNPPQQASAEDDGRKSKVLLLGISHGRGIANLSKEELGSDYEICSIVKPSAGLTHLTEDLVKLSSDFTKRDHIVIVGGPGNSLDRDVSYSVEKDLENTSKDSSHTNVEVVEIFDRYDKPWLHRRVRSMNARLGRALIRPNASHIGVIEVCSIKRDYYTSHGLHLNSKGKKKVSHLIANRIKVVMDVIKVEPEIDPLRLEPHDITYETEENKEGHLLDLQATSIKTECVNHSPDLTSEIKVEDSPLPIILNMMKCEVKENSFSADIVQQEHTLSVSLKENEVLTESFADSDEKIVPTAECDVHEEQKLTLCRSYRIDGSIGSDIDHSSIKCDICNKIFVTSQSLKSHFRSHTSKKSCKCNVCGKCFLTSNVLKRHTLIHTGERPFHCAICGKSFSSSAIYKVHARVHSEERPFHCNVCEKTFRTLGNYKVHARIHTGEKPYTCQMCGKFFSRSGALNKHVRIHSGERPYKCDVCGKTFSQSENLKSHARVHAGDRPLKCDVCGKCFTISANLKAHACLPRCDRSYKCDVCGKCFTASGSLNILEQYEIYKNTIAHPHYILNTQLQFNTHTLFDIIIRHSIQTANPHHRNNTPPPLPSTTAHRRAKISSGSRDTEDDNK